MNNTNIQIFFTDIHKYLCKKRVHVLSVCELVLFGNKKRLETFSTFRIAWTKNIAHWKHSIQEFMNLFISPTIIMKLLYSFTINTWEICRLITHWCGSLMTSIADNEMRDLSVTFYGSGAINRMKMSVVSLSAATLFVKLILA